MNIFELKNIIGEEIVDFNELHAVLHNYAHPRGKINQWLKTGELIRVKKGLYIFGDKARRVPYSMELLANLIYGPSAISLQYALAYYGLIPEAVNTVTSITSKRHKKFNTPIGDFSYTYLPAAKYALGIQLQILPNKMSFLIASPEKALCDLVALSSKDLQLTSEDAFVAFLFEDLRIDEALFSELSLQDIQYLALHYRNTRLKQFAKYTNLWMKKHG